MTANMNPIAIHFIWHPRSGDAKGIAANIFRIFRNDVTEIHGGLNIPVRYYSEPSDRGTDAPLAIDMAVAKRHLIIFLIDESMIDAVMRSGSWCTWFNNVKDSQRTNKVIPITLSHEALDFCNREGLPQAICWHEWDKQGDREKIDKLTVHLMPTVFNILREEAGAQANVDAHKKVHLFLSYAKADGRDLALAFRGQIQMIPGLADFFDEVNIEPGENFEEALRKGVGEAAILVIHTDAYASRDWCCWEVVAAKRLNVPIVAAHCVKDREHRAFPYLGNVPSVRVNETTSARVLEVIRRLLEDILRELLWRCLVRQLHALRPDVLADAIETWRLPEVVWLILDKKTTQTQSDNILVLHPDPPLGDNERSIVETFNPKITLLTPTQLMAK